MGFGYPWATVGSLTAFAAILLLVRLWRPKEIVGFGGEVLTAGETGARQPTIALEWAPFIAGTSILASWILIALLVRPGLAELREIFRSFSQAWGAFLVGVFIFGLAYTFNHSGMAATMANGFSKIGNPYILLAPVLGWIAVALSGSNTSSNAVFGQFQVAVARLLHFPILLTPSLNSVGAEVGKPVAPQTASVGVSTTKHVRDEGR